MRKSLIMVALAAALPFHMSDVNAAAASAEDPNAGASPAADAVESASESSATNAPDGDATGTTDVPRDDVGDAGNASAPDADASTGAADAAQSEAAPVGDAGNASSVDASGSASPDVEQPGVEVSATESADAAPINEDTGKVEVAADSHAEAKDRFAGLLTKIHALESDSVEDLRAELLAIGTLLHLHSKASTDAALTGDYKATDLS